MASRHAPPKGMRRFEGGGLLKMIRSRLSRTFINEYIPDQEEAQVLYSQIHILEYLKNRMDCDAFEDLLLTPEAERQKLKDMIERIAPEDVPLEQWNDALRFFTGTWGAQTGEAAKQRLLRFFEKTNCSGE